MFFFFILFILFHFHSSLFLLPFSHHTIPFIFHFLLFFHPTSVLLTLSASPFTFLLFSLSSISHYSSCSSFYFLFIHLLQLSLLQYPSFSQSHLSIQFTFFLLTFFLYFPFINLLYTLSSHSLTFHSDLSHHIIRFTFFCTFL